MPEAAELVDPRLAIGGNNPPIKERLGDEFEELLATADNLVGRADATVDPTDDKTLGAASDLVKDIASLLKRTNGARESEKAPFLNAGREVDSFFMPIKERAEKAKVALERRVTAYLRRKADEERRQREEEERRARDEARRLFEEAQERDRQARAAEAEAARQKAEENKTAEAEARATQTTHEVQANLALQDAADAERDANAAGRAAAAKPAELARTRGESSLATLATVWRFEITDINAIPLEQLRAFIPRADIEKAVRQHVRIHKDKRIAGVRIYEEAQARVV